MDQTPVNKEKNAGSSLGRRNFIRQSVVSLGVSVHEFIKHSDPPSVPQKAKLEPCSPNWLRPPGAVEEAEFLERCTKCGDCISACPYLAIRQHPYEEMPVIFPEDSSCQLCDDFPCIKACEADALLPVDGSYEANMGLAVVSHKNCTAEHGCNACVSKCPVQAIGMDFSAIRITVDESLCVGCGMCQQICRAVNDRVAIKVVLTRLLSTSV
jgi:ferredoxin-type protein NapG